MEWTNHRFAVDPSTVLLPERSAINRKIKSKQIRLNWKGSSVRASRFERPECPPEASVWTLQGTHRTPWNESDSIDVSYAAESASPQTVAHIALSFAFLQWIDNYRNKCKTSIINGERNKSSEAAELSKRDISGIAGNDEVPRNWNQRFLSETELI